jgi:hypothetical protein
MKQKAAKQIKVHRIDEIDETERCILFLREILGGF